MYDFNIIIPIDEWVDAMNCGYGHQSPSLLTAAIWNVYEVPGNNEVATNDVSVVVSGPVVIEVSV